MHEMYTLMMDQMLREQQRARYGRAAGRPVPAPRARRRRGRRDVT